MFSSQTARSKSTIDCDPSSHGLSPCLEIWRALNIGQDQGVQIHRSLVSVELELQLTSGLPVPCVSLQSFIVKYYRDERPSLTILPDKPWDHPRPDLGWEVRRPQCILSPSLCCSGSFLMSSERWITLPLDRTLSPIRTTLFFSALQLKFKTICSDFPFDYLSLALFGLDDVI